MFLRFEEVLERIADSRVLLHPSFLFHLLNLTREDLALFSERWPQIEATRRQRVMRWLVETAGENFEADFGAVFRLCLGDPDEEVRALAIDGLWEAEDTATLERLLAFLEEDASGLVRAQAAAALGRFVLLVELGKVHQGHGPRIREALLSRIRSPHEPLEVRRRAVESVAYFGGEEIQGVIANAYADDSEEMRRSAVLAMGRSLDASWSDVLLAELGSPSPAMRGEAARACGELECLEAVGPLVELVEDADGEVAVAAIGALGQIGGERAREVLQAYSEGEDEELAGAAVEALSVLEFSRGLPEVPLRSWFLDEEEEGGGEEEV